MERLLVLAALTAFASGAIADEVVKFALVARDGHFSPANLEVPAGKRIKIEIANEGTTPMEFESLPLKVEKVLGPGARSSVVINPLKAGQYPFFDDFHPDTSRGFIVAK
ncbi:MAG: cupredoxin domain-containing protein [Casimicrobiaceae bacterium]